MGGTSFVHFKRDEKVFRVFVRGSAGHGGSEELCTVPELTGCRGRLQFLLDNAEQPAESLPEEIRVTWAKGIEVQMLALAWSDDALSRLADNGAKRSQTRPSIP